MFHVKHRNIMNSVENYQLGNNKSNVSRETINKYYEKENK